MSDVAWISQLERGRTRISTQVCGSKIGLDILEGKHMQGRRLFIGRKAGSLVTPPNPTLKPRLAPQLEL